MTRVEVNKDQGGCEQPDQGGCEQRIEVIVKMQKKKVGGGPGWVVWMDVNTELKLL